MSKTGAVEINSEEILKEKILNQTISIFNEKGFKCTMDDIAKACGISKKTIYTVYSDKEAVFLGMVDYVFDAIKEAEEEVVKDKSLEPLEKIRKLMGAMPDIFADVDFSKLSALREKMPAVYEKMASRLESGWEVTIELIEKAKKKGIIRKNVSVPIVKVMMESSLERFFQKEILAENDLTYKQALEQVVDILIDGMKK